MADDSDRYSPMLKELLSQDRVMPLGPGNPNPKLQPQLMALGVEELLGQQVKDMQMGKCVLAGVCLYHDFLDESHKISQVIDTPEGGYWHAILHRREPDYANSKYWFRRVGDHPVFKKLNGEAHRIGSDSKWDPFAFVDVCEQAAREGGALEATCLEIQMKEWWSLFDYCFTRAMAC